MTEKKGLGPYKQAVADAIEKAGDNKTREEDKVLFHYPSYEIYKEVQTLGNKKKLKMQFVKESHIVLLSRHITSILGNVQFGICHGTRKGLEQAWFRKHLPGEPDVIGTEISDTATQFAHTIEWDFHDVHPDWTNKADFVYSNSWDHCFDPEKAFSAWIDALRPGGLMLLDYTKGQSPEAANPLDPFGTTLNGLCSIFTDTFAQEGRLLETFSTREINREYKARVVVFQKNA